MAIETSEEISNNSHYKMSLYTAIAKVLIIK